MRNNIVNSFKALAVLALGGILSLSACASSNSSNLAQENAFFDKAMNRCHNYLEGVKDSNNDSWCSKHMPGQNGRLKNIAPGGAMGGGGISGKSPSSGFGGIMGGMGTGIGGGVSGKTSTSDNVEMPGGMISSNFDSGRFDTFFEPTTMTSEKCKHDHAKPVSYSIIVKEDGHIINRSMVTTTPGCRVVASSLDESPYPASETKVLVLEGLGATPVVEKLPSIGYFSTGVQIVLAPNAKDPSKVQVSVREAELMKIIKKEGLIAPIIGKYSVDGDMALKKGVYTELSKPSKPLSSIDKNGKIHTYSISIKED